MSIAFSDTPKLVSEMITPSISSASESSTARVMAGRPATPR